MSHFFFLNWLRLLSIERIDELFIRQQKILITYVLAVKENQGQLYENIEDEFRFSSEIETSHNLDCGHGRIETLKCSVISSLG
jgi:hypothetical protein